jgi:hypothetical protein
MLMGIASLERMPGALGCKKKGDANPKIGVTQALSQWHFSPPYSPQTLLPRHA